MSATLQELERHIELNGYKLAVAHHAVLQLNDERNELASEKRKAEARTREVVESLRLDALMPPINFTLFEAAGRRVPFNTFRPEVD